MFLIDLNHQKYLITVTKLVAEESQDCSQGGFLDYRLNKKVNCDLKLYYCLKMENKILVYHEHGILLAATDILLLDRSIQYLEVDWYVQFSESNCNLN